MREGLDFNKTNFGQLRRQFEEVDWNKVFQTSDIEEKKITFLNIWKDGYLRNHHRTHKTKNDITGNVPQIKWREKSME